MEKRYLLAFILSFFVLFSWSAITPKPQRTSSPSLSISSNKTFTKKRVNGSETDVSQRLRKGFPHKSDQEKKVVLSTEKLRVTFSTWGGNIVGVEIKDYHALLPLTQLMNISGYENKVFKIKEKTDRKVVYSFEEEDREIIKTYELNEGQYTVHSEIKIINKSSQNRMDSVNIDGLSIENFRMDSVKHKSSTYFRDRGLFEYVVATPKEILRKNKAYKFSSKERREKEGKVWWVGFRNRYFCALVKPQFGVTGYFINPINDKKLTITLEKQDLDLPSGGDVSLSALIYIGPEKLDILKKYKAGFEKIRRYYKFTLFDAIAKIIYGILQLIHKLIPNWGISIILIGTIVYFSMYPMTLRSMQSMRKMQALQPKMTALRKKYENNPQKLNKEIMELYRKHRVNPMGGCLPMLLQLPVFIGLYQVLWRSVAFKGAHFLWIKDLSEPDRLIILPRSFPIIGNEINLLPIIMMGIMFVQQKLTANNMGITDPQQLAQQKMMARIMPFFMGFIFYHFASGLTLYFTMFYLFSTFTQWKIRKDAQ